MFRLARLYAHTLRHLRPWQVAGRLVAPVERRLRAGRLPEAPEGLRYEGAPRAEAPRHEPWNTREALLDGRFRFLEHEEPLGWPPDWRTASMPLLWRFNLHYLHYLHLLEPEEQRALWHDWIDANPPGDTVPWHPYPTSLRLVNGCRVRLDDARVRESLYRQAAWLSRNLETYVGGNHLLENARALVIAGALYGRQGEAPRWLELGLDLFRREVREQILPDGMHYERSPMYHALMLEGVLDLLAWLSPEHAARAWIVPTAHRMADALLALCHPDGRLALFNDSTHEIAARPAALLDYLEALTGYRPKERPVLPHAGYFVHRGPDLYLALDGGPVAPDYLMAHAHADVFSYELSLRGRRVVVDAGVYEYPAGGMRHYVRSTEAHNTVSIDGRDQVECWGSFRVARRAAPRDVTFHREEGGSRFSGRFDGWARLLGDELAHHRDVFVDERAQSVTVVDRVEGSGRHRVESRVRLHPEVEVEQAGDALVGHRDGVRFTLHVEQGTWRREQGWYCPAFGVRRRCPVVVVGSETTLPVTYRYVIRYS